MGGSSSSRWDNDDQLLHVSVEEQKDIHPALAGTVRGPKCIWEPDHERDRHLSRIVRTAQLDVGSKQTLFQRILLPVYSVLVEVSVPLIPPSNPLQGPLPAPPQRTAADVAVTPKNRLSLPYHPDTL